MIKPRILTQAKTTFRENFEKNIYFLIKVIQVRKFGKGGKLIAVFFISFSFKLMFHDDGIHCLQIFNKIIFDLMHPFVRY